MDILINKVIEWGIKQPDKLAVGFKDNGVTYGALAKYALGVAAILKESGIGRGDHVLFTALSKPEMPVVYLGIQYLGAVSVFMDKNVTPQNAVEIYQNADGVLYITDKPMGELANRCRLLSMKQLYAAAKERAENLNLNEVQKASLTEESDLSELLFTTGTTGKPKGVMLSYKAVYHIFTHTIQGIGIKEDEVLLEPLPLNHSFALRVLRAVLYRGATVVLQNGFAFGKETETNIERFGCTAFATVPASLEIIYSQMQDQFAGIMGRLRYIEVGAGSLTAEQRKRFTGLLPDTAIYNVWGSSETGGALFVNVSEVVNDPQKVYATGKPLPGIVVSAVNEEGLAVTTDKEHPARMRLQGDMIMSGYYRMPELNEITIQNGWLLTSDMVYTDEEGYVYMLGRADDIINVGGEKVSPVEIENIACEYEHITECACIGSEDPEGILGQVPILFVVPKDGAYTDEDLTVYLSKRCERYKLPQKYVKLTEIPRNRMQKIDRKALQAKWAELCKNSQNDNAPDLMNPIIQNILTRRSIRRFTEKKVSREIIEILLKCGYYAPSGHNMQTWRFTVIDEAGKIQELKEASKKAAAEHKVICYGFENPGALILISNDNRNVNACQDASCAAENIMLAAHSLGLGSTWINVLRTLRDVSPVKELLDAYGIPENHTVWAMVALGWPEADGVLLAKKDHVVRWIE